MWDGETSSINHNNQNLRLSVLEDQGVQGKAATFHEDKQYIERMEEFQRQLDLVKKVVKPGCSEELLNMALSSLASLADFLDFVSSKSKLLSSL